MIDINFEIFPNLESKNLRYRRVVASDWPQLVRLRGNAETMKYIPRPLCKTESDCMFLIAKFDEGIASNSGINWGIISKESDILIGLISFHIINKQHHRAEIGYMISPEYQGKGLISEGIKTLLQYGFAALKLHSVEAMIDPDNLASERVLLANNFVKEAHFIENEFYDGKFLDKAVFSILARNFNKGTSKNYI